MPITTTPSGGAQGEFSTYTPIYATTLSSGAASVTFSNIPSTFTDLILIIKATSIAANYNLRFNGDTTTNYSYTGVYGSGASATSSRSSNNTVIGLTYTSSGAPNSTIQIQNYASPSIHKTVLIRQDDAANAVSASVGLWRKTPEPINSITIVSGGTIPSGSTFTLYGIKAAIGAPKADGGNIINSDGSYWYHTFTSTGKFTPYTSLTCDYLIVAGGGSGGHGGGGAGGYRTATSQSLTAQSYTAVVGAGGINYWYNPRVFGTSGSDSSFNSVTSTGGGRGATGDYAAATGGSGGGGAATGWGGGYQSGAAGNTPSTSPAQGFAGGTGGSGSDYAGGGGGGASANGSNQGGGAGGAGGAGSLWSPLSTYYSGGGGAGGSGSAAGGIGGGGAGASGDNSATSGTINTGGGGGGVRVNSGAVNVAISGAGGSGVIIVRYPI